jgi:NADH-quinone oxidoreductase subunit H
MSDLLIGIAITLLKTLGLLFAVILPMVSYTVYAERRVSAMIQDRVGPNRVGPSGLIQPIADAVKLLLKEDFTPAHVNKFYYWLAPACAMAPSIMALAVVPFGRFHHSEYMELFWPVGPLIPSIPSSAASARAPR